MASTIARPRRIEAPNASFGMRESSGTENVTAAAGAGAGADAVRSGVPEHPEASTRRIAPRAGAEPGVVEAGREFMGAVGAAAHGIASRRGERAA